MSLETSTDTAGSAQLQSQRPVKYNTGQGVFVMFTAKFTTCTANSIQEIGIGDDTEDGLFFGCNGDTFGVFRRSDGSDTFIAKSNFQPAHH